MKGNTLNVISREKYNDVATSLWIKKGNSTHGQDVQGIVLKFSNGKYMITRSEKMSDGKYKLQWMASNALWGMVTAKDQWLDYQNPLTEAQNTAFESADGLQLTVVRSGNILTVYVNGEKIPGGTVVLDESYASSISTAKRTLPGNSISDRIFPLTIRRWKRPIAMKSNIITT